MKVQLIGLSILIYKTNLKVENPYGRENNVFGKIIPYL